MAISSLRSSYAPHAKVALRLLAGVRSQASITPGDISTLSQSRTAGGQEESPLNDSSGPVRPRPEDRPGNQSGTGRDRRREDHQAETAPNDPLETDTEGDMAEDASPAGLVTMGQLGPEERLRAAEEAYGYSRHILSQDSHVRLGDSYDSAS